MLLSPLFVALKHNGNGNRHLLLSLVSNEFERTGSINDIQDGIVFENVCVSLCATMSSPLARVVKVEQFHRFVCKYN